MRAFPLERWALSPYRSPFVRNVQANLGRSCATLEEPMPETLLVVLALIIAIGVVAILVLLLRPRAAPVDYAAEQRLAELNTRIQTMGEMLARAQSQLQQTVHERLDAVTQNLGESMKTSTKNTTDHLQQLHARLAVIDSAQKNIQDLASTVTSLQKV